MTPLYDSMFAGKPALEELSFGPPWSSIPGLEDSFAVALEIAGGCFGMGWETGNESIDVVEVAEERDISTTRVSYWLNRPRNVAWILPENTHLAGSPTMRDATAGCGGRTGKG